MKTLSAIFIVALLLSCASIKLPDGTEYNRWGNQELNNIEIKASKPDGSKVSATLGAQRSEREIREILDGVSANVDKLLQIILELERKIPGGLP